MKRRHFIGSGVIGMAAAAPSYAALNADTVTVYRTPPKDITAVEPCDVLVCGGGTAGTAAAVAAARKGASVRLIELKGGLGGTMTTGLVNNIIDSGNKTGFVKEFETTLQNRDGRYSNRVDPELSKLILEEYCVDAGVKLRYHTRVTGAVVDRNNRLTHVITQSKAGTELWPAKAFIDSTGDGDLSVLAGCGFEMGDPETGKVQAMSYLVYLAGVGPLSDLPPLNIKDWNERTAWMYNEIKRGGYDASYQHPTFYAIRDNLAVLMANHEYGVDGTDPDQVTAATIHGRRETAKMIDALRSLGGRWKDLHIVATPEHIGVRESRRIHGRYTVSADDLIEGVRHDDAVCRATFVVDIHSTDPTKTKGIDHGGIKTKPYDIPLRALIARDVEGLMMAGRNISGDFWAHGSYRVIGNTMTMGEAAGLVAAKAASAGRLPHEIAWDEAR